MGSLGKYLRLTGWAVGLGLLTAQLARLSDGRGTGLMIAVACAVLMWRIVAAVGPLVPRRAEPVSSTDAAPQESTVLQRL